MSHRGHPPPGLSCPRGGPAAVSNPFLVCSDPELPLQRLLQAFVWRWEIKVNFRDGKTVLGVGEAQVRAPAAVQAVTSFVVAAYAFLLLAAAQSGRFALPPPKWRQERPRSATPRPSSWGPCDTNYGEMPWA